MMIHHFWLSNGTTILNILHSSYLSLNLGAKFTLIVLLKTFSRMLLMSLVDGYEININMFYILHGTMAYNFYFIAFACTK